MGAIVDPSQLPSATRARFAVLFTIVSLLAFGVGEEAAPFFNRDQTGTNALYNGALSMLAVLGAGTLYYLFHSLVRSRSFGKCQTLERGDALESAILEICKRFSLNPPVLLVDNDIRNYDAIAFGFPWRKVILMGRGLRLLYRKSPQEFNARLAHELGHIRNGDIATTFLAEGLVVAGLTFLTLFYLHELLSFVATLVNGWHQWSAAGDSFVRFLADWAFWISRAVVAMLGNTLIAGLWALVLLSEHRSFLRLREFYADIASARAFGPKALKETLGGDQPNPPWYARFLAAHPTVQWRKSVIDRPALLYEPTVARLARLGYVVGMLIAVFGTIHDLPDVDARGSMVVFLKLAFTTIPGAIILVILMTVTLPPAIAIGSLVFRTAAWIELDQRPFTEKALKCLKAVAALVATIWCGLLINPINLAQIIRNPSFAVTRIVDWRADAALVLITALQLVVALPLGSLIIRRLLTAPKETPPRTTTWFFLGVSFYLSIAYIGGGFGELLDPSVPDWLTGIVVLLYMFALSSPWLLMCYLIARRSLKFELLPTSCLAPWVCYTQKL